MLEMSNTVFWKIKKKNNTSLASDESVQKVVKFTQFKSLLFVYFQLNSRIYA